MALLAASSHARAECPAGLTELFYCEVPERNAWIEMCLNPQIGQATYTYHADGDTELGFTGRAVATTRTKVRGINGFALVHSVSLGAAVYSVMLEQTLRYGEPLEPDGRNSPNPAIVQVYANQADADATDDRPIARRVCDPASVRVDREWFGPG